MELKRTETHYRQLGGDDAYADGFLRTICHTGPDRKNRTKLQGEYIEYYNEPGQKVKKKGSYKDGRIDGELLEYYQDGKLSGKSMWKEGQMIYIVEYDQQGRVIKSYGDVPNE